MYNMHSLLLCYKQVSINNLLNGILFISMKNKRVYKINFYVQKKKFKVIDRQITLYAMQRN